MTNTYSMADKEFNELYNYAKKFGKNDFDEFTANVDWEDWMENYTTAEDGEPATEQECDEIESILREIFDGAHNE